ncbi:MAG TPA: DNA starvation/stationary phase protection protein [Acidimicrobiia bacterium]|jgi:starvation-inducible DNA-binding protein|nr:DNA starvation/stationary phase protection protein [Acidimicrobiia bacterium]
MADYTVPGMSQQDADQVLSTLSGRLASLLDLSLTLKHIHWNVIGEEFIAVHKMLDPQVDSVRAMVDETAERIATLGGSPNGTPKAIIDQRTWDDYPLGKADVLEHLTELDKVYVGVIQDHRKAQEAFSSADPVSEDLIIGQLRELELYHWFVRAHLESTRRR